MKRRPIHAEDTVLPDVPRLICLLMLPVLLVLSQAASARTPDQMTPAEESVCDGQRSALKGLCIAYCEAMDCDSPAPHASETACRKVLENYMSWKKRDEEMPCQPGTPEEPQ
jgi:hypothetical protein